MTRLPPLPPFKVPRDGEKPRELAGFRVCDVCGQRFDTEDLDAVFHHGKDPHEPMKSE